MRIFFAGYELEEQMEEDGMVQHLRQIESNLASNTISRRRCTSNWIKPSPTRTTKKRPKSATP